MKNASENGKTDEELIETPEVAQEKTITNATESKPTEEEAPVKEENNSKGDKAKETKEGDVNEKKKDYDLHDGDTAGGETKVSNESELIERSENMGKLNEEGQEKSIGTGGSEAKGDVDSCERPNKEITEIKEDTEKTTEGENPLNDNTEHTSNELSKAENKLEGTQKVENGALFSINDVDELEENDEEGNNNGSQTTNEKENSKKRPSQSDDGPENKKANTGNIENDGKNGETKLPPEDKDDPTLKKEEVPMHQLPEITREDKTLDEVLEMMDDEDFTPIIPDAVTDYYLAKSGFSTSNRKIKRLLALATQKFISDIATDAYEYSRIRSNSAVYNSANPQVRARALMTATVMNLQGNNPSEKSDGENSNGENATSSLTNGPGQQAQNQKVTLTMEDLSSALDEYGLNVNRPQFYR